MPRAHLFIVEKKSRLFGRDSWQKELQLPPPGKFVPGGSGGHLFRGNGEEGPLDSRTSDSGGTTSFSSWPWNCGPAPHTQQGPWVCKGLDPANPHVYCGLGEGIWPSEFCGMFSRSMGCWAAWYGPPCLSMVRMASNKSAFCPVKVFRISWHSHGVEGVTSLVTSELGHCSVQTWLPSVKRLGKNGGGSQQADRCGVRTYADSALVLCGKKIYWST